MRTTDGKVHTIGDVESYSAREDFAVFSVEEGTNHPYLDLQQQYQIGGQVFSVGNALGEGIVIRNGSLTSETAEERNGEWKWLRFSAAASPGNSGGPLLDEQGKVIGVVLGKSPNENSNFALPIARVSTARAKIAHIDIRQSFRIPVMSAATVVNYQKDTTLPKSAKQFGAELLQSVDEFYDTAQKQFLAENENNIFPRGEGSAPLLTTVFAEKIATIISQQNDGRWDIPEPSGIITAELPGGASMQYVQESGWTVLQLKQSTQMPVKKLFSDSKGYMDLVLKGIKIDRPVMDQAVRITSLGVATREEWFVDKYGRKWQLRVWPMPFMDSAVISLALPKPDGAVAMVLVSPFGFLQGFIQQGQYLTNLMYTGYSGSLQEWQEFMAATELQPAALRRIHLGVQYDHKFTYGSDRMSFEVDDSVQNIKANSPLSLNFAFFKDQEQVVWNVGDITLGEDPHEKTYVTLSRETRPATGSSKERAGEWEDMVLQRGSYDGQPHNYEGSAWMTTAVTGSKAGLMPPNTTTQRLYLVTFNAGANIGGMRTVSRSLLSGLKILE